MNNLCAFIVHLMILLISDLVVFHLLFMIKLSIFAFINYLYIEMYHCISFMWHCTWKYCKLEFFSESDNLSIIFAGMITFLDFFRQISNITAYYTNSKPATLKICLHY